MTEGKKSVGRCVHYESYWKVGPVIECYFLAFFVLIVLMMGMIAGWLFLLTLMCLFLWSLTMSMSPWRD